MNDAFLTYNFKKPEYIEENNDIFSDFNDIPYPIIDTSNSKDYNKPDEPKEKPKEQLEEKILPVITKSPSLPKKSLKLSMNEFKKQLMPDAERIAKRLNVDPNVILAQAFLESGGDTSKTLFGIKAQKGYKGKSTVYNTKEQVGDNLIDTKDAFRTYDSISESFDDYANLISGRRYKSAMGKSPQEYYQILKNQGYATDNNYVKSLMNVYNQMIKS